MKMRLILLLLSCILAGRTATAGPGGAFGATYRIRPESFAGIVWAMTPFNTTLSNTDITTYTAMKGGSGSQSTNGARPAFTANARGSYPAITFDGVNDCIPTTQQSTNLIDMANTNGTIALVYKETSATTALILASSAAAANASSSCQIYPDFSGTTYFDGWGTQNTNGSRVQLAGLTWTNTFHVLICTRSNGTLKAIWKDGTNQVAFVNGTTLGTNSSIMTIGSAAASSGAFAAGQILDGPYAWTNSFTSNQLVMMARAFGQKFGLSTQ